MKLKMKVVKGVFNKMSKMQREITDLKIENAKLMHRNNKADEYLHGVLKGDFQLIEFRKKVEKFLKEGV